MSFTFTTEDGTGLATANSYVSLSEADDYFAPDLNFAATWDGLSDTAKEYSLAWASRILDQKTDWRGTRVDEDSGLRWPRSYVYDRDDNLIDDNVVPKPVKDATCELAKYLQENDLTTGGDVDNIRKVVVDVIEIEFQEGTSQTGIPTILNAILTGLGSFRIGGRGFGKIIKA
jgi:hypothetical protein